MPPRSKIKTLPPKIREDFDKKLIVDGFRNYAECEKWFAERDYKISRSSAQRYGKGLEKKVESVKAATDMATALTDQVGDDAGKMNDAVQRMYQEKIFNALLEMEDIDLSKMDFVKLGRAIKDMTHSSISQQKWMSTFRNKAKTTADEIAKRATKGGLSAEKAKDFRKMILGIAQ
ncbi:MAG: DUF3486 family protein [Smithellaceae bacterium]|jgi:hypothetical protein